MNALIKSLVLISLCLLGSCKQDTQKASFASLGRVVDGDIEFTYEGASGTSILVNNLFNVTPTKFKSANSAITGCKIKDGTTALPSGFIVNPLTCQIIGFSSSPMPLTTYIVEVTNSTGKKKSANLSLRVLGLNSFSGVVAGLPSGGSVVISHGKGSVTVSSNGPYTLPDLYAGDSYSVTATSSDSATFLCSSQLNSGVATGDITNNINCFGSGSRTLSFSIVGLGVGASLSVSSNGETISNLFNGTYTFSPMTLNTAYSIAIDSVSAGHACSIVNASGTLTSNVNNVVINCGSLGPYVIKATISGISGGTISLTKNGNALNALSNGSFNFSTQQNYGSSYSVTIVSLPAAHTCTLTNGSGLVTGPVEVFVGCIPDTFSLGGNFSGLDNGESLTIEVNSLNGNEAKVLNGVSGGASTAFAFTNRLNFNQTYNVKLVAQPSNKICSITNGSGQISNNSNNTLITCVTRAIGSCDFGSVVPWKGNNAINGMHCDGTHLYVAGSFTAVGPISNNFAVINNSDADPIPDQAMPINLGGGSGTSNYSISDNEGGWFVSGYGKPLKHLKSDLSVDPNFNSTYSSINKMKIIGNYLYLMYGREDLIRVNRFTGAKDLGFNIDIDAAFLRAIETDGTNVYVAGRIVLAGGIPKKGIVKFNHSTGIVDHTFSPSFTTDAAQTTVADVGILKIHNGELYVGGNFLYVNGDSNYSNLAKFSLTGVLDTTFKPIPSSTVSGLEVYQGKLFVSGSFTTIFGQSKKNLAVIDIEGNSLPTNEYGVTISGSSSFSISNIHINPFNGYLYLGMTGELYINGSARKFYGVYDLNSKLLLNQKINANDNVTNISTFQNKIMLSGSFQNIYSKDRPYFGRLKLTDGKLDETFAPTMNNIVNSMSFNSLDNSLILGGSFTSPSKYLAKWALGAGTWDSGFVNNALNGIISKIEIFNNKVFAIGNFISPQKFFAAFNITTGATLVGYPNLNPDKGISTLNVNPHGVFLAGLFDNIDGSSTHGHLVRVDHLDGHVTSGYFPSTWTNTTFYGINYFNDALYVSGLYTDYAGSAKNNFIKLDLMTSPASVVDDFRPGSYYSTYEMCIFNSILYYSGSNNLSAINLFSGASTVTKTFTFSSPRGAFCTGSNVFATGLGLISQGI